MCIDAKRMSLEEDLTVLIDYEKYQERTQGRRLQRQVNSSNKTNSTAVRNPPSYPYSSPYPQSQDKVRDHNKNDCDDKECEQKVCDDTENEIYQECGSKCVLGCRYATTSSGVTVSKHDCEKNDCVEGCFCKTGLVRHQAKCIPASECPVRKCNHRYEVYMCGPAAPITCDNALRGEQISDLTRHVECIWGCYCAQGFLRNNYNGKCVSENECRNTKAVDISPQIPGLFKHIPSCTGSGCPNANGNTGNNCGPKGCGSNNEGANNSGEDDGYTGSWQNLYPPSSGAPVWGYPSYTGIVGPIGSENSTGGCNGRYPCNAGLPVTQISLENGTTVTIPIIPGTQIDVATGTINTGEDDSESREEEEDIVGEEPDEVESNEESPEPEQNNNKPTSSKPQNNGSPVNGYPNPFINPYLQFPFNGYPSVPPFNPYFGAPPQFGPQNYFNYPAFKKPERGQTATGKAPEQNPISMKSENEAISSEENSEEEQSSEEDTENESQPNVPNASSGIQAIQTPMKPSKKKMNSDRNRIPPNNQSPYFNYFNTFNPNQYYQNGANSFNEANKQGYQQQFVAPNPQFNGFNPYNFQQNANPFGNPQFNGFPNQGGNMKKQNNKNGPYGSAVQPVATNGFKYSNTKKFLPNAYKEVTRPVIAQQNNDDSGSSDDEAENSEIFDDK